MENSKGKKLIKVGGIVVMIAVGTLLINLITPTSSSYAFILFLFPIEFVFGLVLLVVGYISRLREVLNPGRIVITTGAIIGILSVFLSAIIPELFSWYKIESYWMIYENGVYLTGFGTSISTGAYIAPELSILVLIGGMLVIGGSFLCIIIGANESATTKLKVAGIIGGFLMLIGPILLIIDLVIGKSDFARNLVELRSWAGGTLFEGTYVDIYTYTWGLWIGFFLVLAGGVLGLIGGIILIMPRAVKTASLISERLEKEKYDKEVEYKLFNYLNTHEGNAFTVQALKNRTEEFITSPGARDYCSRNIETILERLIVDGKIKYTKKEGISHYWCVNQ